MDNIALAYVTCDKYSHVWDEWYNAFNNLWGVDMPKYFCGEYKGGLPGFTNIPHEPVEAKHWTTKLSTQVEQIDAEYIFVWLDDLVQLKRIDARFMALFDWLRGVDGDSLRFMPRASASRYDKGELVAGGTVYRLKAGSPYTVSFHPNIYRKDFLLEVLSIDESPWDCELKSQHRYINKNVYAHHIDGWVVNRVIQEGKTQ